VSEAFVYGCEECGHQEEREAEGTLGQIKCPDCGGLLRAINAKNNSAGDSE